MAVSCDLRLLQVTPTIPTVHKSSGLGLALMTTTVDCENPQGLLLGSGRKAAHNVWQPVPVVFIDKGSGAPSKSPSGFFNPSSEALQKISSTEERSKKKREAGKQKKGSCS